MVLLTPSAVSAVISVGVVSIFTFLLFLSGYVLQQQTVRSLQEAIRKPPEPKPIPTLPAKFRKQENLTEVFGDGIDQVVVALESQKKDGTSSQVVVKGEELRPGADSTAELNSSPTEHEPELLESLAYILSLPEPADLCSAVLFAKQQRQFTNLVTDPSIVILYPTTWETSPTPLHISALTFMRDMQSEYSLTYLPVELNTALSGVTVNTQLLGELQRRRWDYDRAMYLKSPGLVLDTQLLDRALAVSAMKKSWTPLSGSAGIDPEMLMYSKQKGLLMARSDMRRLTASAMTSHKDHHATEMDVEAAARSAAYVVFDEAELEHRKTEREWFGGVFERFERERTAICKGRGLLPGDEDKLDLKR